MMSVEELERGFLESSKPPGSPQMPPRPRSGATPTGMAGIPPPMAPRPFIAGGVPGPMIPPGYLPPIPSLAAHAPQPLPMNPQLNQLLLLQQQAAQAQLLRHQATTNQARPMMSPFGAPPPVPFPAPLLPQHTSMSPDNRTGARARPTSSQDKQAPSTPTPSERPAASTTVSSAFMPTSVLRKQATKKPSDGAKAGSGLPKN